MGGSGGGDGVEFSVGVGTLGRGWGGGVLETALERGYAAALVERPPRPDRRHRLGRGQAASYEVTSV